MAMDNEIKVRVSADTGGAERKLESLAKNLERLSGVVEQAQKNGDTMKDIFSWSASYKNALGNLEPQIRKIEQSQKRQVKVSEDMSKAEVRIAQQQIQAKMRAFQQEKEIVEKQIELRKQMLRELASFEKKIQADYDKALRSNKLYYTDKETGERKKRYFGANAQPAKYVAEKVYNAHKGSMAEMRKYLDQLEKYKKELESATVYERKLWQDNERFIQHAQKSLEQLVSEAKKAQQELKNIDSWLDHYGKKLNSLEIKRSNILNGRKPSVAIAEGMTKSEMNKADNDIRKKITAIEKEEQVLRQKLAQLKEIQRQFREVEKDTLARKSALQTKKGNSAVDSDAYKEAVAELSKVEKELQQIKNVSDKINLPVQQAEEYKKQLEEALKAEKDLLNANERTRNEIKAKAQAEAQQAKAAEQAEKQRIKQQERAEKERLRELARQEAQRVKQQERLEKERLREQQRLEKEHLREQQRLERERIREKERLEKERIREQKRLELEANRELQRAERERIKEKDRLERERIREQKRQAEETKRSAHMLGETAISYGASVAVHDGLAAVDEYQKAQTRIKGLNLPDDEFEEIQNRTYSLTRDKKYLSRTDALKLQMDAITAIGHNDRSYVEGTIGKASDVAYFLHEAGYDDGSLSDITKNLYGLAEARQQVDSVDKTNSTFEVLRQIVQGSGGKIDVNDVETIVRSMGNARAMLTDDGLRRLGAMAEQYKTMGKNGGSGAPIVGNVVKMLGLYAAGKPTTIKGQEQLIGGGVISKEELTEALGEVSANGKLNNNKEAIELGKILRYKGFTNFEKVMEDPIKAIREIAPNIIAYMRTDKNITDYYGKGFSQKDGLLYRDGKLLSKEEQRKADAVASQRFGARMGWNNRAIDFLGTAMNPVFQERVDHSLELQKHTRTTEEQIQDMGKNWGTAVNNFKTALKNLAVEFEPLVKVLADGLNGISEILRTITVFAHNHQTLASVLGLVGGFKLLTLSLRIGMPYVQGVFSIFKLGQTALAGTATATTAAATATGGFAGMLGKLRGIVTAVWAIVSRHPYVALGLVIVGLISKFASFEDVIADLGDAFLIFSEFVGNILGAFGMALENIGEQFGIVGQQAEDANTQMAVSTEDSTARSTNAYQDFFAETGFGFKGLTKLLALLVGGLAGVMEGLISLIAMTVKNAFHGVVVFVGGIIQFFAKSVEAIAKLTNWLANKAVDFVNQMVDKANPLITKVSGTPLQKLQPTDFGKGVEGIAGNVAASVGSVVQKNMDSVQDFGSQTAYITGRFVENVNGAMSIWEDSVNTVGGKNKNYKEKSASHGNKEQEANNGIAGEPPERPAKGGGKGSSGKKKKGNGYGERHDPDPFEKAYYEADRTKVRDSAKVIQALGQNVPLEELARKQFIDEWLSGKFDRAHDPSKRMFLKAGSKYDPKKGWTINDLDMEGKSTSGIKIDAYIKKLAEVMQQKQLQESLEFFAGRVAENEERFADATEDFDKGIDAQSNNYEALKRQFAKFAKTHKDAMEMEIPEAYRVDGVKDVKTYQTMALADAVGTDAIKLADEYRKSNEENLKAYNDDEIENNRYLVRKKIEAEKKKYQAVRDGLDQQLKALAEAGLQESDRYVRLVDTKKKLEENYTEFMRQQNEQRIKDTRSAFDQQLAAWRDLRKNMDTTTSEYGEKAVDGLWGWLNGEEGYENLDIRGFLADYAKDMRKNVFKANIGHIIKTAMGEGEGTSITDYYLKLIKGEAVSGQGWIGRFLNKIRGKKDPVEGVADEAMQEQANKATTTDPVKATNLNTDATQLNTDAINALTTAMGGKPPVSTPKAGTTNKPTGSIVEQGKSLFEGVKNFFNPKDLKGADTPAGKALLGTKDESPFANLAGGLFGGDTQSTPLLSASDLLGGAGGFGNNIQQFPSTLSVGGSSSDGGFLSSITNTISGLFGGGGEGNSGGGLMGIISQATSSLGNIFGSMKNTFGSLFGSSESGVFDTIKKGFSALFGEGSPLMNKIGGGFTDLFGSALGMLGGAMGGKGGKLVGALGGAMQGYAQGGWVGAIAGAIPALFADGGAFGLSGQIHAFANGGAFTNSIFNSPTLFKFANGGKFGVMGEAGPEAVMPLSRDGAGRLGVAMHGGFDAGSMVNISINITHNGDNTTESTTGSESSEWNATASRIKSIVQEELLRQKRPGGMLSK